MAKLGNTVLMLAIAGVAASAQAAGPGDFRQADHNGAREIARGDYTRAERVLSEARRVSPNDPELLLNLAQVYLRSGRTDAARALYREVMARPDEAMQLTGERWQGSHALARSGLQAASATTIVSR